MFEGNNTTPTPTSLELKGVSSKQEFDNAWTSRQLPQTKNSISLPPRKSISKFKFGDRVKVFLPTANTNSEIKQYEWHEGEVCKVTLANKVDGINIFRYDVITSKDGLKRWNLKENKLKSAGETVDLASVTSNSPKTVNNTGVSIKIEQDTSAELKRLEMKRKEIDEKIKKLTYSLNNKN